MVAFIVTDAGRAAITNAQHNGTNAVQITKAGISATAITPTAQTAALPDEIKRITDVSGQVAASDTIHLIIRDTFPQAYTVRSIALYLADGTLFGIYGQATPLIQKTEQSILLLAMDIKFANVPVDQITFGDTNFLNPPATTELQGVVELATDAEAAAGTDTVRAVTPSSARKAVVSWIGYAPANRAGDTFSGGVAAPTFAAQGAGIGSAILTSGDASHSGLIGFFNVLGVRQGYVGFATNGGPILFGSDNGGGFSFLAGSITRDGSKVWDAGNDGSGSGLDADLLDGLDSASFVKVGGTGTVNTSTASIATAFANTTPSDDAFNGGIMIREVGQVGNTQTGSAYAPAVTFHWAANHAAKLAMFGDGSLRYVSQGGDPNKLLNFHANVIYSQGYAAWHAGNDGSGSGLDADLLDGQHGAYYADVVSRLGYTPVEQVGGNKIYIGWSGSRIGMQVDGSPQGNIVTDGWLANGSLGMNGGVMLRNGNTLWGPDNDGAGSGLDADLLDGYDSSAFGRLAADQQWTSAQRFTSAGTTTASTAANLYAYARPNSGDGAYMSFLREGVFGLNMGLDTDNYFRIGGWSAGKSLLDLSPGGDLGVPGQMSALRFRATANGDGQAIAIGDDAWIGDVNYPSGISIRGQQEGRAGYVLFGDSTYALGVNAGDWTLRYAGNVVWTAGSDGAGSGLDADMLDGYDSSAFVKRSDISSGSNANGNWERRATGVIEQWGYINGPFSGGNATINFPIAFASSNPGDIGYSFEVFNTDSGTADNLFVQLRSQTNGSCLINFRQTNTGSPLIDGVIWRAIGR